MKNYFAMTLIFVLALSVVSMAVEKKAEMKVDGMTCNGCVEKVKTSLEKVDGVKSADVSLENGLAVVMYDDDATNEKGLHEAIKSSGYKVVENKESTKANSGGCEK